MCNPMAFVMAAQTAMSIKAGNEAAEASQAAAVSTQAIMNSQRTAEMEDINRKVGLELTEKSRESLREQSAARVASAESGVAGASPLRSLVDVYVQGSIAKGSIMSKGESELAQVGIASQGDFISARNAIQKAESTKSTGLQAALQIGTSAAAGYYGSGGTNSTSFGGLLDSSTPFASGSMSGNVVTPGLFSSASGSYVPVSMGPNGVPIPS